MRLTLIAVVVTFVVAACGSSSGAESSTSGSTAAGNLVTGVYLQHDSADPLGGTPVQGVTIGVYPRAISSGPVMANPPSPIARVRTGSGGTFSVHVDGRRRVFLAPIDAHAYAPGKWVRVGVGSVTVTGCSDCVRPM